MQINRGYLMQGFICGIIRFVGVHMMLAYRGKVVFSHYTWVGYFIALSATGYVVLIAMVLKPDAEGEAAARVKDTVSLGEAKKQIIRTRAYISYHVGFINNFR